MKLDENLNSIPVPFFSLIGSIGQHKHQWYHFYSTGTLFWSLTRLYGCYYRILMALPPYNVNRNSRVFLDSDIESFVIRMRIVLNEVAFIVRLLLPENARGIKGPKGAKHPKNKEMSIHDLYISLSKSPQFAPEIMNALQINMAWIGRLRDQRDNIVHYKSKALIFEFEPDPISFAFMDAAGTQNMIATPNGGSRVVTTPVLEFVNSQMLALHNFLNTDLCQAVDTHILREDSTFVNVFRSKVMMQGIGVSLFRQHNNIS